MKPCALFERKDKIRESPAGMRFPDGQGGIREGVPWTDENGTTFVSSETAKEIAAKLAGMEDKGSRAYRRLYNLWVATVTGEAKARGTAYAVAGKRPQEALKTTSKKVIAVREMTHKEHMASEQIEAARRYWEGLRAQTPTERSIETFVAEETRKAREEGEALVAAKILEIGEDADKLRAREAERERLKKPKTKPRKVVVRL